MVFLPICLPEMGRRTSLTAPSLGATATKLFTKDTPTGLGKNITSRHPIMTAIITKKRITTRQIIIINITITTMGVGLLPRTTMGTVGATTTTIPKNIPTSTQEVGVGTITTTGIRTTTIGTPITVMEGITTIIISTNSMGLGGSTTHPTRMVGIMGETGFEDLAHITVPVTTAPMERAHNPPLVKMPIGLPTTKVRHSFCFAKSKSFG